MPNLAARLAAGVVLFLSFISQARATGNVALQWDPNPEPDISGYRLFYGPSSGNYTQQIDVRNTTAATVSNLADGTYFFVVTAYNTAIVESLPSDEVSAIVGVGPTPTPTPTATAAATPTPGILGNISTRLRVQSSNSVLICGMIATGTESKPV